MARRLLYVLVYLLYMGALKASASPTICVKSVEARTRDVRIVVSVSNNLSRTIWFCAGANGLSKNQRCGEMTSLELTNDSSVSQLSADKTLFPATVFYQELLPGEDMLIRICLEKEFLCDKSSTMPSFRLVIAYLDTVPQESAFWPSLKSTYNVRGYKSPSGIRILQGNGGKVEQQTMATVYDPSSAIMPVNSDKQRPVWHMARRGESRVDIDVSKRRILRQNGKQLPPNRAPSKAE